MFSDNFNLFKITSCKYPFLFFSLFFLNHAAASAQTTGGMVVGDNSVILSGASVRNYRTKESAIAGTTGAFNIRVVKGDTLITSCIGYRPDTLTVANQQQYLIIALKQSYYVLNGVEIRGKYISPLDRYLKNQEDYKQIYRIGDKSHMFYVGVGFGVNIDALYSALSMEGKNARRLQRTIVNDYHNSSVDSRFTKALVAQVTGYQGQKLDNFIMDNRPSFEFIEKASDYELTEYIRHKMLGVVIASDSPAPVGKDHKLHIKFVPRSRPVTAQGYFPQRYP